MSPDQIVAEVLKNGLVQGSFLALLAVAFSLVYRTTSVFHIAQGACFLAAGYTAYLVGSLGAGGLSLACVAAALASASVGVAIDMLLYRNLQRRGSSAAVALVASLALLVIASGAFGLAFGNQLRTVSGPVRPGAFFLGILLTETDVRYVATGACALLVIGVVLGYSSLGLRVRGCSVNLTLLQALGHNPAIPRAFAVIAGSCVVGIAAGYQVFRGGVDPASGWPTTIMAAVATIMGGRSMLLGPAIAALVLGLARSATTYLLSDQWADTITYVLLLLIIVARPEGLTMLARRVRET